MCPCGHTDRCLDTEQAQIEGREGEVKNDDDDGEEGNTASMLCRIHALGTVRGIGAVCACGCMITRAWMQSKTVACVFDAPDACTRAWTQSEKVACIFDAHGVCTHTCY